MSQFFCFSLLLTRENLESPVCLGILEDKAPRYVMNRIEMVQCGEILVDHNPLGGQRSGSAEC